jgi:hypothetical protein
LPENGYFQKGAVSENSPAQYFAAGWPAEISRKMHLVYLDDSTFYTSRDLSSLIASFSFSKSDFERYNLK